jgi:signal peptidase I
MAASARRSRRSSALVLLAVLLGVALCAAAAMYVFNPTGTASGDLRARIFGYATYRIPSTSMLPTLQFGDMILVSSWSYARHSPQRGDVIVYFPPHSPGVPWVSRVAGVPGDVVAIRDGVLSVNGTPVREPYLDPAALTRPESITFEQTTVPADGLFMLGDNRDQSEDSRFWGFASTQAVVGRVNAIWYARDSSRVGHVR